MQDLDGNTAGQGAFWGTFNSSIHLALGCIGVITDSVIRDIDKIPEGIQLIARGVRPSHQYVHIVDFGLQVNVCSMVVQHDDLVHADVHGAVSFPAKIASEVIRAATDFVERERPVIEACQAGNILH
jgi:regulator of RNase E activity RraA